MWYILLYILYIWYSVPEQESCRMCQASRKKEARYTGGLSSSGGGAGCTCRRHSAACPPHPSPPPPPLPPFYRVTSVNHMGRRPWSLAQVGFSPRGTGREESQVLGPCLLPGLLQLALSLTTSHPAQLLLALIAAPPWASPRSCPHFYKQAIR